MPTYAYKCPECETYFDRILRISQCDDIQSCPECDHAPASKVITAPNFILQGDGWPGKNEKIKNQMRKKNERMDKVMEQRKRDAPGVSLSPNVNGERVDSWGEAKHLAASKGLDTSGYEKYERKSESLKSKITTD
jgi:putative FmdB family regulatory protein